MQRTQAARSNCCTSLCRLLFTLFGSSLFLEQKVFLSPERCLQCTKYYHPWCQDNNTNLNSLSASCSCCLASFQSSFEITFKHNFAVSGFKNTLYRVYHKIQLRDVLQCTLIMMSDMSILKHTFQE